MCPVALFIWSNTNNAGPFFVQVDVIVNTTAKGFNLNCGAVSAAIAKAAGPSLQDEVNKAAPGGVAPGQIIVTSGGNLRCCYVYHGALETWDGPTGNAPKVDHLSLKAWRLSGSKLCT